ncbi:MAG: hypothetical protein PUG67_07615 [Peptoniphilaceae bacterium]|nr:hypothetical protein [Peptoniphilaceae bacterium]
MKLKKKLMLTTILAISVFVSSTSYATDKQKSEIKIDEEKLNNLVEKVNEDTIITDVSLPKDAASGKGESKTEGNKPVEEIPKDSKPEANEAVDKKVENTESIDMDKKNKEPTGERALKDLESKPNEEEVKKENLEETQAKEASISNTDSKPNPSLQNNNPAKENIISKDTSDLEFMDRLNNIQSQEVKKPYINKNTPKTASLERLTSKQTLVTSFDDKGSNLRLNLANTADGKLDRTSGGDYVIKPQTLIILIAILAAILSSISIAIRGNKFSKKQS